MTSKKFVIGAIILIPIIISIVFVPDWTGMGSLRFIPGIVKQDRKPLITADRNKKVISAVSVSACPRAPQLIYSNLETDTPVYTNFSDLTLLIMDEARAHEYEDTYCSYRILLSENSNFVDTANGIQRFVCNGEELTQLGVNIERLSCRKEFEDSDGGAIITALVTTDDRGLIVGRVGAGAYEDFIRTSITKEYPHVRVYRGSNQSTNTGLEALGREIFPEP